MKGISHSPVKMVKTRAIQVRLTISQHEALKRKAELKGFPSVSSFLRFVALDKDSLIEEKIIEIHRYLLSKKGGEFRRGSS